MGAQQLDCAATRAAAIHHQAESELRIGVSATSAGGRIYDILRRFKDICPTVQMRFLESTPSKIIREVVEGSVDVSFAPCAVDLSGVETS